MENKSHAFWAGLFVLALTATIACVVFFFNIDRTVRVPYELLSASGVNGLSVGSAVRYRGLAVGRVTAVGFDRSRPGQVRVRIMVDREAPITQATFATLANQGLAGSAFVQLDDDGSNPTLLSSSDAHVEQLPMREGIMQQLQKNGTVIMRNLERVSSDADKFLSDDSRQQLNRTLVSLQHAADSLSALANGLTPVTQRMPQTLQRLNQTLASTNTLMQTLNRPDGPVLTNLNKVGAAAQAAGIALSGIDESLQQLSARVGFETLPRVNALADNLGQAAQAVDQAATTFNTNPRSVLFGAPPRVPGPGEPGFNWTAGAQR